MRIIGTLITILGLSVSWGQTDLCRPSVFKDGSIWKGSDVIEMFTLTNASGMSIKVTNYAASLTDVSVPDRQGQFEHVVLGFDSLESYLERHPKFGATVGRFANRIRNAEFSLNGQTYHLEKNNKEHSIHGGTNGFNRQVFKTDTFYTVKDTAIVVFKYKSTHLEGGFPGNIELSIAYKLTNHNEIVLEYTATTDKPTVVNFTNHSYFNLDGHNSGSVLQHTLTLEADYFTPGDAQSIPTGEILPVENTPMDFREGRKIGERIEEEYEPLRFGNGYDHNWVLKNKGNFEKVAELMAEESGIVMETYTDRPGMQIYTANFVENEVGKEGVVYGKRSAVCLETQCYPDAVHHENFPSPVYRAGEKYTAHTAFRFLIKK